MKLSIVIPACNEEETLEKVVKEIKEVLQRENICNEIIIIDDNSTDQTGNIADRLSYGNHDIQVIYRKSLPGFGRAIREGLEKISGDVVVIVMGDASDDPRDILRYYYKIKEGYDCVFGSRFIRGGVVKNYPLLKLLFNRLGNNLIRMLFLIRENDITNAFKAYRREVIEQVKPLVSNHFNLCVEIPLKAINRGFSRVQIPINWYGRQSGISKLSLREVQRKYLFSIFYVWLEKILLGEEIRNRRNAKH